MVIGGLKPIMYSYNANLLVFHDVKTSLFYSSSNCKCHHETILVHEYLDYYIFIKYC